VLARWLFVFKDKRFRANGLQVLGGAVVLGLLVVAGWYVTGHLGYGENPDTLETVYFATNTRTLESLSFVAPLAYTLELLMMWTDTSLHASFGIASVVGVVAGSAAYALASAQVPLGGLCVHDRPGQPVAGCGADGLWRRHGRGLHGRAGSVGPVDPGDGFGAGGGRHHGRFGGDAEVHVVAGGARMKNLCGPLWPWALLVAGCAMHIAAACERARPM
jgi:hypothetical protein